LQSIGSWDVLEGCTICPDKTDSPLVEEIENLHGGLLWSCNLAIRRAVFNQIGGFNEMFMEAGGEDMELAWRIREQNISTRFVPEMVVEHPSRRVGWKGIVRRALMNRWLSLYHLCTRRSMPLGCSKIRVVLWLIGSRMLNQARMTVQFFREISFQRWKRPLFLLVWNMMSLPLLLPYYVIWELRFRAILQERVEPLGKS
jgi:GT2 family glycosyltransferase